MLRGYRIIIAAIGLAVVASSFGVGVYFGALYSPENKQQKVVAGNASAGKGYNGPSKSLPDIAGVPSLVERAISNHEPSTGQDHEKRDLAAQEASAMWAFWMVLISTISATITAIGTIFLYKQIVLTREAVKDTGDATEAMREANDIARENTKLELRPYLYIDSIENIIAWTITTGRFAFETKARVANLTLKNFGQSPAKKIHIKANASIGEGPHSRIIPDLDSTDFKLIGDIPPNGVLYYEACKIPEIDKPTTERIQRAGESIFLEGQICYEDGFGTPYHTNFQFAYTGEKYWGKPPMITPNWNDAT